MKKCYSLLIMLIIFSNVILAKSIYVSKSNGTPDGDGSLSNPYSTIADAVTSAASGDVINILDGVYREEVIITKSNITITSDNDEVYITGTDIVDNFEITGNGIYKAYVPHKVTQVFFNGVPQVRAKYPNQTPDKDLFNFTTIAVNYSEGKITSDEITQPDGFFDGATVWMLTSHRWVAGSATVTEQNGNTLTLSGATQRYYGDGIAFISNCKNCLDNDGEWYWGNDTLYYKNSKVDVSELKVEAKTRETLIYFDGVQNVTVSNINGYAGSVLFDNTKYCALKNGEFKYLKDYDKVPGSYMRGDWNTVNSPGQGIGMHGTSDTLSRCIIAWAAGDCITLYGTNNVVTRCYIHDGNYRATDCGVVSIGGYGNKLFRSEIYNGGRDVVISDGKAFKIMYSEIYNTGLLAWDLGAFYTWYTDGGDAEIAYNHVHDAYSGNPDNDWGAVGIYLDNGSRNFLVHHNVIYNIKGLGIQYNYPGQRLRAYNNTIYNTARAMGFVGGEMDGVTAGECKLYNNYSDKGLLNVDWVDTKNNIVTSTDFLQDRDDGNYIPEPGCVLIDKGILINETENIPYSGIAPDIGAYEYGRIPWEVGPDSETSAMTENKTLRDTSGMVLRGKPVVLGKTLPGSVEFAMDPGNWEVIKNNGFNTIRVCWVDPWYKDRGKDNWSVSEVLPYLDTCVMNASNTGMNVIINFHNTGAQQNYDTTYQFVQEKEFWDSVAPRYKDNDLVYYELVNEPVFDPVKYTDSVFKSRMLDLYKAVRTNAPEREVLMFSFSTIDPGIVDVVEDYSNSLNRDRTSVAYHMYNYNTSLAIQSLMADHRVICTEWNYNFVGKDEGKDFIREVDGYKENAQTLESISSSWVDWRDWSDTSLNMLLDTLIFDALEKDYWWGEPVAGVAVTGVNIKQDSVHMLWDRTLQLNARICPALSENQKIHWSLSDTVNAIVDSTGMVTTRSTGFNDTVTVYSISDEGAFIDSCVIFISQSEYKCAYPDCEPHPVPGEINATHFDKGGEGLGYHDLTEGNGGDGPRQDEDVDTDYKLSEGSIMDIMTGEWLEYTIDVKETGGYDFEILFATSTRFGKFHIEIDGVDVTGSLYVKASGSLSLFNPTVIENILLTEGIHLMRICFDYAYYNMGTITINSIVTGIVKEKNNLKTKIYPNPVSDKLFILSDVKFERYSIYTMTGQMLMQGYINSHQAVNINELPKGNYIITLFNNNIVENKKFIKY